MKKKIIILISYLMLLFLNIGTISYALYSFNHEVKIPTTDEEIKETKIVLKNNNTLLDSTQEGYDASNNILKCYASSKKNTNTLDLVEVKNLSCDVYVSTEILSVVRIKISQVWEDYKSYLYGTQKSEIVPIPTNPDLINYLIGNVDISGNELTKNENWNFDMVSGYIYFKGTVMNQNGNGKSISLFSSNNDYEYPLQASNTYIETMYVSLSFEVEVCQANRAETLWNVSSSLWEKE